MFKIILFIFQFFPPEFSHFITLKFLRLGFLHSPNTKIIKNNSILRQVIWNIEFNNPIGLAAGFDKNAEVIDEMLKLGFGFIEVGTVTPKPQSGNPKPRLFRLIAKHALINRMGFNNNGVDHLVENLKQRKVSGIVWLGHFSVP